VRKKTKCRSKRKRRAEEKEEEEEENREVEASEEKGGDSEEEVMVRAKTMEEREREVAEQGMDGYSEVEEGKTSVEVEAGREEKKKDRIRKLRLIDMKEAGGRRDGSRDSPIVELLLWGLPAESKSILVEKLRVWT